MKRLLLALLLAVCVSGKSGGGHGHSKCYSCGRDAHGRIKRSRKSTKAFERTHPCPSTGRTSGACPGYVIDHIVPLKRGGADEPSNMQWQTYADGRAKDKVE